MHGKAFFEILKKYNFIGKIKAFVLSVKDETTPKEYNGVPVISALEIKDINTPVIIAVSYLMSEDIKKILTQIGVKNIIHLSDYLGGAEVYQINDVFSNKSFREICDLIADWYVATNDINADYDEVSENIYNMACKRKNNKNLNKKRLTYITDKDYPRDYKIIKELSKNKYEIEYISAATGNQKRSKNDLISTDIKIKNCSCVEEVFYYALKSDSSLFMIDEYWKNAETFLVTHMTKFKEFFGKIIFMPYDLSIGCNPCYYTINFYISERYALENADGVVFRYLDAADYLSNDFNIVFKRKPLTFMDYCEEVVPLSASKKTNDNKLKIANVASNLTMVLDRNIENREYSYEVSVEKILKIIGNRDDCELDLFAWTATQKELEHINELKKQYNNFNFHLKTPHKDLLYELQKFDYLLDFYSTRKFPKWPVSVEGYSDYSYIYSMCNRYFDAISAGIGIIASIPTKLCEYLEEYGVLANMTFEEFDVEYLKANKEKYKANAIKARDELMIDKHINKLMDFIDEIMED